MSTYYIPTSSLNFNNILSSESLSPKSFYTERKFGYPRWTQIPENPYLNSLVLYDQYCGFERLKSDYEDHPLLIEIEIDDSEASTLRKVEDHIFLSDHTIYIDPFSTRLIFFSEKDKRITLSMSEASLETKFVHLYRKRIIVAEKPKNAYKQPDPNIEEQKTKEIEIEKDKRINRMKGLLYGYYIGALLSTSKEYVVKLNNLHEIYNVIAAIISNVEHKATTAQTKRLQEIYPSILPEVPFYRNLEKIGLDQNQFEAVVDLVRKTYRYIPGEFDVNRFLTDLSKSCKNPEGQSSKVEEISSYIDGIENEILKSAKLIFVDECQIRVMGMKLDFIKNSRLSKSDAEIFKSWINEVLSKDKYNGKISTFKDILSDDVTFKAKDVCGAKWQDSDIQKTLNALRKHVRGAEFDYQWKNDLYSALSALIIRGDNWQDLLRYMQSKEMIDYRLAFAMYGTINGFADLPRDFTDILLNRKDSEYIAEVYKEFYGQLYGRKVVEIKQKSEKSSRVVLPKEMESDPFLSNPIWSDQNHITDVMLTDSAIANSTNRDSIILDDTLMCDRMNKEDLYLESKTNLAVPTESKGVRSKGKKNVSKAAKAKKPNQTTEQDQLLFKDEFQNDIPSSGEFLRDFDFLTSNQEFCNLMDKCVSRKEWLEDLRWFIDAHDPKRKDYKYYENKSTNNVEIVDQFLRLNKNRYAKMKDFLKKLYLSGK